MFPHGTKKVVLSSGFHPVLVLLVTFFWAFLSSWRFLPCQSVKGRGQLAITKSPKNTAVTHCLLDQQFTNGIYSSVLLLSWTNYTPMKQMKWVCRPGNDWQGNGGQGRSSLEALSLQFAFPPHSLHPASSLRPTNGTSARLCLLQPQTPAKLAGLAAFAESSGFPFGFIWSRHGSHPPSPHRRSGRRSSRQQTRAGGVCWIRGGHGARVESLPFSLCGKGWNAIIIRLPIK